MQTSDHPVRLRGVRGDTGAFIPAASKLDDDEVSLPTWQAYEAEAVVGDSIWRARVRIGTAATKSEEKDSGAGAASDTLPRPEGKVALFLCGNDADRSSVAMWARLWPHLQQHPHAPFVCVGVDMPGVGCDTFPRSITAAQRQSHEGPFVAALLRALGVPSGSRAVTCFAEGLGAGTALRAFDAAPGLFAAHHVLVNAHSGGALPQRLHTTMYKHGMDCLNLVAEVLCREDAATGRPIQTQSALFNWASAPGHSSLVNMVILVPPDAGAVGCLLRPRTAARPRTFLHAALLPGVARPQLCRDARPALQLRFSPDCVTELLTLALAPPNAVPLDANGKAEAMQAAAERQSRSALDSNVQNGSFRVFVRIRPVLPREVAARSRRCVDVEDVKHSLGRRLPPQRVTVDPPRGTSITSTSFVFDRVLDARSSQVEVFEEVARPMVNSFLAGTSVTMFAYGQTGSGKTHTMEGPYGDDGLMFRSVQAIFDSLSADMELHFSYVQLYVDVGRHNTRVHPAMLLLTLLLGGCTMVHVSCWLPSCALCRACACRYFGVWLDLLDPSSRKHLELVDPAFGPVFIRGAAELPAEDAAYVCEAVRRGAKHRNSAAQQMNDVSSRSHAILRIRVSRRRSAASSTGMGAGAASAATSGGADGDVLFNFVDLAGSERVKRSGAVQGTRQFREAVAINGSLSTLGLVVQQLLDLKGRPGFIAYVHHSFGWARVY